MKTFLKNQLKKLIKNEQGNALVLVALSMVMLCGFTALVVDSGSLFLEKSELQKGLDAAVLAGAQQLMTSESKAVSAAIEVAAKNHVTITASDIKTGSDSIQIQKTTTKELTFAQALGFKTADVKAFSKAQIGGALKNEVGVIPVGIEQRDFKKGAAYELNFTPENAQTGNFGFLAIDGKGGSTLEESIKTGTDVLVSAPSTVQTKPGLTWGDVSPGFQYRIDQDADKPDCNSYDTANAQCSRVVNLPIVESYAFANGRTDVKIIGFAAFWVKAIEKPAIIGQFITIVKAGEFTPIGDPNDFGVYGIRIVQ